MDTELTESDDETVKTKRVLKTYIPGDHQLASQRGSSGKQNGDEKKTRKIMSELGLKKGNHQKSQEHPRDHQA